MSEATETNGNSGAGPGDEEYREAAMQYERKAGREPMPGDPRQAGWDIHSVDPKTGEIVRLIEVKGKGYPWVDDEVVELSRAQVRKAFGASVGQRTGIFMSWRRRVTATRCAAGRQVDTLR